MNICILISSHSLEHPVTFFHIVFPGAIEPFKILSESFQLMLKALEALSHLIFQIMDVIFFVNTFVYRQLIVFDLYFWLVRVFYVFYRFEVKGSAVIIGEKLEHALRNLDIGLCLEVQKQLE